jgi:hypothetical protein
MTKLLSESKTAELPHTGSVSCGTEFGIPLLPCFPLFTCNFWVEGEHVYIASEDYKLDLILKETS